MKRIDKESDESIEALEIYKGKFEDDSEFYLLRCHLTGLFELIVEPGELAKQNKVGDQPVIITTEFKYD